VDADNRFRRTKHDALGRITEVVEDPIIATAADTPLGITNLASVAKNIVTSYSYNNWLEMKVTQTRLGQTQERTFTYDTLGRLVKSAQPESAAWSYVYDDNGNLTSRSNGERSISFDAYDSWGRPVRKYYDGVAATPEVRYCYDGKSFVAGTGACGGMAGGGQVGKVTGVGTKSPGGGPYPGGWSSVNSYTYDVMGRVAISRQETNLNVAATNRNYGGAYLFTYEYNQAGGLEKMRYPSGRVVTTCYESGGRPKVLSGLRNLPVTYATVTQYLRDGQAGVVKYGDPAVANPLTMTTTLNTRMQWKDRTVTRQGLGTLLSLSWTYTGGGNVLTHGVDASGAGGVNVNHTYGYDRLNRLESVQEVPSGGGVTQWRKQVCDEVGNCWFPENTGYLASPFMPTTSGYYLSNNRLSGVGYDSSGNQLNMGANLFSYDGESRLRTHEINQDRWVTYYDGEGRRVMRQRMTVGTGAFDAPVVYAYDAGGQLAAEYAPGSFSAPCVTCFRYMDHLGSTRMVTESGGEVKALRDYLPYGEENRTNGRGALYTASMGNVLGFTGKERDNTGGAAELDYFGARYMSAAQGRFTSPDPKMFPSAFDDPQSWNKYGYVRNNPLRLVDPNGEDWKDVANGFMNAFNTNQVLGIGRTQDGNSDFKTGQAFGDAVSAIQGVAEMIVGTGGEVGGLALDATGVGAVAGVPLNIASAGVITHGVAVAGAGLGNLGMALYKNGVPNPDGSKGKTDHQAKVDELVTKAQGEAKSGEQVLRERKIQGHDSNRKPDAQIVDKNGRTRKVFEAERRPTHKRNVKREEEYRRLGVDQETHKVP